MCPAAGDLRFVASRKSNRITDPPSSKATATIRGWFFATQ
jgi:hypothetical protein